MPLATPVVQLVPRPRPFDDAIAAFAAACNIDCISSLHHNTSSEAAFLRTRALIRLGRLQDAEAAIRGAQLRSSHFEDFAQYYTLLGTVLDRQGDYEGAADAFDDARAYAYSIPSAALHAELGFYEAQSAWRRRDLERTERIALQTLSEKPRPYDEPHLYPLEVSHAFLFELLALLRGMRQGYASQMRLLRRGLDTLMRAPQRHVWAEASLLWNCACVLSRVRVPEIALLMRERAESLTWSLETAERAYHVYRALAWNEALTGNYLGAFRDLREAHDRAPGASCRIESILDRAFLFGQTGENFAAHERFDEASQLCERIEWTRCGEERYVLLWAAEIGAPYDVERASAFLARYKSIRAPMDPALVASSERQRWKAHEHDACGAIAAASGNVSVALTHLRTALDTWDELKFEWRAAKTAGAIARLSNASADVAGARRRAEPFAQSWLAQTAFQS